MTASGYPIPARIYRVEQVIKRSRFITTVGHAPDSGAARSFVDRIRSEFSDATHHCWAFVAGPPGTTSSIGLSDAGEPHGTAGRPMLTTLLHSGVGEVCAVCSRYYGGSKLGTGGLARAYAGGVKLAIAGLPTETRTPREQVEFEVGYAYVDAIRRLAEHVDGRILSEDYGATVRYQIAVPTASLREFERRLADVTGGGSTVG